jgi:hypothetical protein
MGDMGLMGLLGGGSMLGLGGTGLSNDLGYGAMGMGNAMTGGMPPVGMAGSMMGMGGGMEYGMPAMGLLGMLLQRRQQEMAQQEYNDRLQKYMDFMRELQANRLKARTPAYGVGVGPAMR